MTLHPDLSGTSGRTPKVSVVVLNFRGKGILDPCIRSVLSSTYRPIDLTIVDNSPDDGAAEAALRSVPPDAPPIKYIPMNTNVGFCDGFNRGVAESNGEFVLLLNNDTVLTESAIAALVLYSQTHPSMALCEGKIINSGSRYQGRISNPDIACWAGVFTHAGPPAADGRRFGQEKTIFSAIGVWPFIRREVWTETGGYDSDFFITEEIRDLCWRIWLRGYQVHYVPEAVVYHVGRLTSVSKTYGLEVKSNNIIHEAKNSVQILLKNLSMARALYVIPLNLSIRALEIGGLLLVRRVGHARLKIRGYLWIVRHLGQILLKRDQVQKTIRRVSDREALRALIFMNPLDHLGFNQEGDIRL